MIGESNPIYAARNYRKWQARISAMEREINSSGRQELDAGTLVRLEHAMTLSGVGDGIPVIEMFDALKLSGGSNDFSSSSLLVAASIARPNDRRFSIDAQAIQLGLSSGQLSELRGKFNLNSDVDRRRYTEAVRGRLLDAGFSATDINGIDFLNAGGLAQSLLSGGSNNSPFGIGGRVPMSLSFIYSSLGDMRYERIIAERLAAISGIEGDPLSIEEAQKILTSSSKTTEFAKLQQLLNSKMSSGERSRFQSLMLANALNPVNMDQPRGSTRVKPIYVEVVSQGAVE
jgi:hypothetical protein